MKEINEGFSDEDVNLQLLQHAYVPEEWSQVIAEEVVPQRS